MPKKYKFIISDPPWKYSNFKKRKHGAPQYPTMSYSELKELPLNSLADDNSIHLMWTTWPQLEVGMKLVKDWGFKYKTGWPWIKLLPKQGDIRTGLGFWAQSTSEILLVTFKGQISPPKKLKTLGLMTGEDRQFYAPIKKHSQKPIEIHEWAETNFEGPYLELFARGRRKGWDCWGHDTGFDITNKGTRKRITNEQ